MDCPYCQRYITLNPTHVFYIPDSENEGLEHIFSASVCPACEKWIVLHVTHPKHDDPTSNPDVTIRLIYPRRSGRKPLPTEVPTDYSADYDEAARVLNESPKASAALSRRLLQRLLEQHLKIKKPNLSQEIDELLKQHLPSQIAEAVDAVRTLGNFAAHPITDQQTGNILEVGPGEAEWTLDVLESLFDLYFVQPARLQEKKALLDAKLKAAGKPPAK